MVRRTERIWYSQSFSLIASDFHCFTCYVISSKNNIILWWHEITWGLFANQNLTRNLVSFSLFNKWINTALTMIIHTQVYSNFKWQITLAYMHAYPSQTNWKLKFGIKQVGKCHVWRGNEADINWCFSPMPEWKTKSERRRANTYQLRYLFTVENLLLSICSYQFFFYSHIKLWEIHESSQCRRLKWHKVSKLYVMNLHE